MNQTVNKKGRGYKDLYIASAIIGGLIIFIIILTIIYGDSNLNGNSEVIKSETPMEVAPELTQEQKDSILMQPAIADLSDHLSYFDSSVEISTENISKDEVIAIIAKIKAASVSALGYSSHAADTVQILAKRLKNKLPKIQTNLLPKLRKAYCNDVKRTLWRENIEVSCNGRVLNLTGGLFANNANIEDFYTMAYSVFTDLRFNQVRFRWYSGQDEYVYYSPFKGKDSDSY